MSFFTKFFVLSFLPVLVLTGQDAPPNWVVNPSAYQFTASVIAVVRYNDQVMPEGNNILGAFAGSEVRGVTTPIQVGQQKMFFLTVYSNAQSETINFKVYLSSVDTVITIQETVTFVPNGIFGSVANPFLLNAYFRLDRAPLVAGIPDQTIDFGGQFASFDLDNFLTEFDGDTIDWTFRGNDSLQITVDTAKVVRISPRNSNWSGAEVIIFRAADRTLNGYYGEDTAAFRIRPRDNAPILAPIPNQTVGVGSNFQPVDLTQYLTELDGDAVEWLYAIDTTGKTSSAPVWSVNPSLYQSTMTVTAEVTSLGRSIGAQGGTLAAFAGNEVRGVANAVLAGNKYLFFLTIYGNTAGDTITFRFYDNAQRSNIPGDRKTVFSPNAALGSPSNPYAVKAGEILVSISPSGTANVLVNTTQTGAHKVYFIVRDAQTTLRLADTSEAVFTVLNDRAPRVSGIPDQVVENGSPFLTFDLDDYLTELDGDLVAWSFSGNDSLSVTIGAGNVVTVSPLSSAWLGTNNIIFRATDLTTSALSGQDTASFSVIPIDHPPVLGQLPDQLIGIGSQFAPLNLNNYLTEQDGDSIAWSYYVDTTGITSPAPQWSVNPSGYQSTMTVTAAVTSLGRRVQAQGGTLAAFFGNEIRGVANGVQAGGETLFFLTVYGNTAGDTITFRFYDNGFRTNSPVNNRIPFAPNASFGSPSQPFPMNAGEVVVSFTSPGTASFLRSSDSTSTTKLFFIATDANTLNNYSDTSSALFRVINDRAPVVAGIPDQTVEVNRPFAVFDLDDYLTELDGDKILWSVTGELNLSVNIDTASRVTITPVSGTWTGTEALIFRAADSTVFGLWGQDTAVFRILPIDHPPVIGNIPNQSIGINGNFNSFDLDSYLTETDGDSVVWSYKILRPDTPAVNPNWQVNPSLFELTMNFVIEVESIGESAIGNSHVLAAFAGNSIRGVTRAISVQGRWLYFMTVYANVNGEQIRFRFFDDSAKAVYPVRQLFNFSANGVIGTAVQPLRLRAGNLIVTVSPGNFISVNRGDSLWTGTDKIRFTVQDTGTLNLYSDTAVVSFTVFPRAIQPVASPSGLKLTPLAPGRAGLEWTDNSGNETKFVIERKQGDTLSANSYSFVDSVAANTTQFTDTMLIDSVSYSYRVYAENYETNSQYSNQAAITIRNHPVFPQQLNLAQGWNLVSGNISPRLLNLDSVFAGNANKVTLLKNGLGQVYWPSLNINQIGNWNIRHGYFVHTNTAFNLPLTGFYIKNDTLQFTLPSGWNQLSYTKNVQINPASAFASLDSSLVLVKDGDGNVYWPEFSINNISSLIPGYGYQIYLRAARNFMYPAAPGNLLKETPRAPSAEYFVIANKRTGSSAVVLIETENPEEFEEAALLTGEGITVGASKVAGRFTPVTAWGDDELTPEKDGAVENEPLRLVVKPKGINTFVSPDIYNLRKVTLEEDEGSELLYNNNGVYKLTINSSRKDVLPAKNYLAQNYPNPFGASSAGKRNATTIKFGIKEDCEARLEVFDILGNRVAVLINDHLTAGNYETGFDAVNLSSGLYICKLTAGNETFTNKMILIK